MTSEEVALSSSELLLRLNDCLNDEICLTLDELLSVHCTHSNKYNRFAAGKAIVKCISNDQTLLTRLIEFTAWHCLSQRCKLLNDAIEQLQPSDCQRILTWMSESAEIQTCQDHCPCQVLKTVNALASKMVNHKVIDNLFSNLTNIYKENTARCSQLELLTLQLTLLDVDQIDCHSIILDQFSNLDYLFALVSSFRKPVGFCGEVTTSQDNKYDAVAIRKVVLVVLKSLEVTKNHHLVDSRLDELFQIFQQLFQADSRWFITLFLEDDVQLLNALHCLIQMRSAKIHDLLNDFFTAIHNDSAVLLDMLCSDSETAVSLLKMLMAYLKLENVQTLAKDDVRLVLIDLRQVTERLSRRKLFPYKIEPLLNLLANLK